MLEAKLPLRKLSWHGPPKILIFHLQEEENFFYIFPTSSLHAI